VCAFASKPFTPQVPIVAIAQLTTEEVCKLTNMELISQLTRARGNAKSSKSDKPYLRAPKVTSIEM
jgi:hypothetical protein